jgi:hypothetical protein
MGSRLSSSSSATTEVVLKDPTAAATPSAYLIFSSESGGCLTLHWSTTAVPNAILTAKPSKPVPAHKLTQNAGRIELGRNFGVSQKKLFEAMALFIKETAVYDSTVKINSTDNAELWTLSDGTKVKPTSKGGSFATKGLDVVAVMPSGNVSFKGVKTIDASQFVGTATREGAFWKRA